jgi:serpin B
MKGIWWFCGAAAAGMAVGVLVWTRGSDHLPFGGVPAPTTEQVAGALPVAADVNQPGVVAGKRASSGNTRLLPFDGAKPPTAKQKEAARSVASDINAFGFRLAGQLAKARPKENLLISPLSAAAVHSMLLAGTRGETAVGLKASLCYSGLPEQAVHDGMFALDYDCLRATGGQFRGACALMVLGRHSIEKAFQSTLKDSYDAECKILPGRSAASLEAVDDWAKTKSEGMVPRILDRFPQEATFVLLSASAFDADWEHQFDAERTRSADFTTASGRTVSVPTMSQADLSIRAAPGAEETRAIELPYKQGVFAMILVLPSEGQTAAGLLAGMNAAKWNSIVKGMREETVDVLVPKFSLDASYDLEKPMSKLGAARLFEPGADLSGVGPDAVGNWIGADVQRAHIDVDERGTRAGVASAGADTGADNPVFKAERPFIYAVVHRQSGVILFLGICNDPSRRK